MKYGIAIIFIQSLKMEGRSVSAEKVGIGLLGDPDAEIQLNGRVDWLAGLEMDWREYSDLGNPVVCGIPHLN